MPARLKAAAFDVDPKSLASLRAAFPEWEVNGVQGETAASLRDSDGLATADLLVVGARADLAATLGLCRGLRSQVGQATTPIFVLVPPEQSALVTAVLKSGASSCLVLPIDAKEVASTWARWSDGNQPGRHTLSLESAQTEDRWRDDGGQG